MKVWIIHPHEEAYKDGFRFKAQSTFRGQVFLTHGKTRQEAIKKMNQVFRDVR